MPFYQNPFNTDFLGVFTAADFASYSPTWKVPGNINTSQNFFAYNVAPYNLSGNADLTINYSLVRDTSGINRNYTPLTIDVTTTAVSVSAVQAYEVVSALNANTTFTTFFTAAVSPATSTGFPQNLIITSKMGAENFRAYISNRNAESIIRFNKKAGVAQLPSYFARHTIANANSYPDSNAMLVQLDTSNSSDQAIITDAGLDYTNPLGDWQLLYGRHPYFLFNKNTVDGSGRITQTIEYSAGSVAGDLARLIKYTYTSSNTNPTTMTQQPYVLVAGDLISSP